MTHHGLGRDFSMTTPREIWVTLDINPRPRAGGDPTASARPTRSRSFNPRPRAGGDMAGEVCYLPNDVSIHAPARGATEITNRGLVKTLVSIHAPARGATEGGNCESQLHQVSIHAPARGATSADATEHADNQCFNPRPRAGGDPYGPPW